MAGEEKAPESESDRDDQSRRSFGRSGRAAGELAVALRQDFSVAAHIAARKLSAAAARLRARVGETDISRLEARLGAIAGSIRGLPGTMTPLAERWRGFRAASESGRPAGAGRRRLTWFRALALASIAGLALAVGLFYWALRDVPWQEIAEGSLKPVVVLESADGTPIVQQGPFQGGYAKREEFPPHLIDAVLAIEDRRFYEHYGIDFRGVGRAIWRNLRAGEVVEGGSTITQQLIKILYLESDRTFKRKIQELVIAFWLEGKFGKDEILTACRRRRGSISTRRSTSSICENQRCWPASSGHRRSSTR
jgi:penicillin-binding protein 1A